MWSIEVFTVVAVLLLGLTTVCLRLRRYVQLTKTAEDRLRGLASYIANGRNFRGISFRADRFEEWLTKNFPHQRFAFSIMPDLNRNLLIDAYWIPPGQLEELHLQVYSYGEVKFFLGRTLISRIKLAKAAGSIPYWRDSLPVEVTTTELSLMNFVITPRRPLHKGRTAVLDDELLVLQQLQLGWIHNIVAVSLLPPS